MATTSDGTEGAKPHNIQDIFDTIHYIDDFIYICDIIFFIIGLTLNLIVIGAIVLLKRLHLPRILIWIGTGFSNIFMLTTYFMVSLSARLRSSSSTRILIFLAAVFSFCYQTLNVIFAQLERHVCIHHPNWHKKLFTTTTILIVQFTSVLVLISMLIGITNLEAFQEFTLHFFSSWYFTLIATIVLGIFPIGLIGQLVVSVPQNKYPAPVEITSENRPSPQSIFSLDELKGTAIESTTHHTLFMPTIGLNNEKQQDNIKPKSKVSNRFVYVGSNRISRLDLESHRTFSFLAKVYLVFVIITHLVSFAPVFGCLQWFDDADESRCSTFVQLFYYFSHILCCLNSSILNPVGFVALSSDLRSCLKARRHRKSPIAKELKNHEMYEM